MGGGREAILDFKVLGICKYEVLNHVYKLKVRKCCILN